MGLEEKKMPFNLFRKKKQSEQEKPTIPPQEEHKQQSPVSIPKEPPQNPEAPVQETKEEPAVDTQEQPQRTPAIAQGQLQETFSLTVEQKQEPIVTPPEEQKPLGTETPNKTYLKAMPLRELSDLENIKNEVKNGNIIILRVTPLAGKSIEDVKTAVNDLFQFADSISGDIARLGEERVVLTPKTVRIWREKSPAPVSSSSQPLPTAA
jgi:SepF-like predicted cell division protein (DUF552 family)